MKKLEAAEEIPRSFIFSGEERSIGRSSRSSSGYTVEVETQRDAREKRYRDFISKKINTYLEAIGHPAGSFCGALALLANSHPKLLCFNLTQATLNCTLNFINSKLKLENAVLLYTQFSL